MSELARLVFEIDARQAGTADTKLRELERTGQRVEKSADQMGRAFSRLAAPLAAFLGTHQLVRATEQWTTLNNRLRLVTDSTHSMLAAQADVFDIAQRSRQPLQATAELYQRIAINANELGLNGASLAGVVDTINKTMAISGTSAASAEAAMIQLGQAFASGTLRGEELNSVLEQAPALAQAIARGMGVAVGDLKALGEAGALTARDLVQALQNQGRVVDEQFAKMQKTGGQALTMLGNSLTRMVGEFDQATGASAAFADQVASLSQSIDDGAFLDGALQSLDIWRATLDSTGAAVGDLSAEVELLGDVASESGGLIADAFVKMPANITTAIKIATVEIAGLVERAGSAVQTLDEALAALFTSDTVEAAFKRGEARYKALLEARESSIVAIMDEHNAILSVADAEQARRDQERTDRAAARQEREKEIAQIRERAKQVEIGNKTSATSIKEVAAAVKKQADQLQWLAAVQDRVTAASNAKDIDILGIGMGDRAREQLEELNAIQQEYAQRREELARLQGGPDALSNDMFQARIAALRAAQAEEIAIVVEGNRQKREAEADWTNGANRAWENYRDNARDIASQTDALFTNAFGNMEDAIVQFAMTGKLSFADFTKSILADMARIATRQASSELLGSLIGMAASAWGGGPGDGGRIEFSMASQPAGGFGAIQAKGGAWSGGVQMFAKGGVFTNQVVDRPTLFPFAKGAGLMGEAGPEAIMPLKRGADGSLGVMAIGGGGGAPTVNVVVNVDSSGASATSDTPGLQQFGTELGRFVEQKYRQLVARDLADGGQIKRAMAGGYR